jgi:AcrR family transcriptional regulator
MSEMRKDAVRSRLRMVQAARDLVASGESLALNAVARAADVGVGTVYRHFGTVEALEDAVVLDRFENLAAILRDARPDRFEDVLTAHFTLLTEDVLFERVTARAVPASEEMVVMRNNLIDGLDQLMKCAVAQGHLRPEVDATTVLSLVCGLAHAARSAEVAADSPLSQSMLRVMFDGMRLAADA